MKPTKTKSGRSAKSRTPSRSDELEPENGIWELKLYIAGQTPKSLTAFSNLKRFCEENLKDQYRIEVIDLAKHPELARKDQILALPTLVRKLPAPLTKIIGDLSDKEKVLLGFNLKHSIP